MNQIAARLRGAGKRHRVIAKGKNAFSKNLVVELKHGLANRLCSYVSSSIAARMNGKRLVIRWIRNQLCNCDFEDLFENEIEEGGWMLDFDDDTNGKKEYLSEYKTMFYADSSFQCFRKTSVDINLLHDLPFFNGQIDDAALEFSRELNLLRPTAIIQSNRMKLPPGTIGVHIRTHDLPWWKPQYMGWFFDRLDSELLIDSNKKLFLATDCSKIREQFLERYQNSVICYRSMLFESAGKINFNRNSVEGMQGAVLDLVTLGDTEKILKTPNSSFGWLASMWNLIPIEVPDRLG